MALQLIIQHGDLYKKITDLKRFKGAKLKEKLAEKVQQGHLTQDEMNHIVMVEDARWDAIQVDEFTPDSMKHKAFSSVI